MVKLLSNYRVGVVILDITLSSLFPPRCSGTSTCSGEASGGSKVIPASVNPASSVL